MSDWFDGDGEIGCSIQQVAGAFEDPGEVFLGVVSLMPGLTSVELVDGESASVTIRTNEGLMTRTNISKSSTRTVLSWSSMKCTKLDRR